MKKNTTKARNKENTKFKENNLTPKSLKTLKNLGVIRCCSVFNIFVPFVSSW